MCCGLGLGQWKAYIGVYALGSYVPLESFRVRARVSFVVDDSSERRSAARPLSGHDADGATAASSRITSPPLARFASRAEPGVPRGVLACDFEGDFEGVFAFAEGDFEGVFAFEGVLTGVFDFEGVLTGVLEAAFASAAKGNLAGVFAGVFDCRTTGIFKGVFAFTGVFTGVVFRVS